LRHTCQTKQEEVNVQMDEQGNREAEDTHIRTNHVVHGPVDPRFGGMLGAFSAKRSVSDRVRVHLPRKEENRQDKDRRQDTYHPNEITVAFSGKRFELRRSENEVERDAF
jgi:hypothetical protein